MATQEKDNPEAIIDSSGIFVLSISLAAAYYTLISTSTPLGSSSFIRASTVLAVEL